MALVVCPVLLFGSEKYTCNYTELIVLDAKQDDNLSSTN